MVLQSIEVYHGKICRVETSGSPGWVIGRLHTKKHVEPWVCELPSSGAAFESAPTLWPERKQAEGAGVREIVGKMWPCVVIGIAIGACIHGFVPTGTMAHLMGKSAGWWHVRQPATECIR